MPSTSEKLGAVARTHGWVISRLRANGGKVAVDYFAHGRSLLKVVYDARGRVSDVCYHPDKYRLPDGRTQHLGHGDTDKVKAVMSWLQAESK